MPGQTTSTDSDLVRTFIAAEISDDTRRAVERVVTRARTSLEHMRGIRWTRPEGWHLTLKFLGEIGPAQVDAACGGAERVASAESPFTARLGSWGGFPNDKRPNTVWVGLPAGAEELTRLAASLDWALARAGFAAERRPYHPHLTLARMKDAKTGSAVLTALHRERFDPEAFQVDRLVVLRSELGRGGARYTPLREYAMGGGPANITGTEQDPAR